MTVLIISICGFLSMLTGIMGLYRWATRDKRTVMERMKKYTDTSESLRVEEDVRKDKKGLFKKGLGSMGRVFVKRGMTKELATELIKADIPLRPEEFLIIWMVAGLGPGTVIFISLGKVVAALFLYLLGIIIPPLIISIAQQRRVKKFDQQICDSLSIISNALRAGFSFMQALDLVSREMPDPIGAEFARSFREMKLGTPMEEALQALVGRVPSPDLDLVVTAVLIQRQVGGNMAEILDSISLTIRERVRIQGEIRTLTAQGRISGLVIGLIPPILMVLLLLINPSYMSPLIKSPLGWLLLGSGIVAEIFGLLIIKNIINIDF